MKIPANGLVDIVTSCSWCDSGHSLPNAFCWTRMQTEAGQSLDVIMRRKELERTIGNGVFYWGIGNALGASMMNLLNCSPRPEVLFSIMRSKPKYEDTSPSSLLLWTSYLDNDGISKRLPPHALILSRGDTARGAKNRHYALVCYSEATLFPTPLASLDFSHFRNLAGKQSKIGFSQVTAIIEHFPKESKGTCYEISMRATLKNPYFIKLTNPKKVLAEDSKAIEVTLAANPTFNKWREFVFEIRNRPYYASSFDLI